MWASSVWSKVENGVHSHFCSLPSSISYTSLFEKTLGFSFSFSHCQWHSLTYNFCW